MWFQLVLLPIVVDRLRPRLERHVLRGLDWVGDAKHWQPHALVLEVGVAEDRSTISITWRGQCWACIPPAATTAAPTATDVDPADDILRAAALTAAAATLRAALLRSLRRLRSLCRGALLPGVLTLVRQK